MNVPQCFGDWGDPRIFFLYVSDASFLCDAKWPAAAWATSFLFLCLRWLPSNSCPTRPPTPFFVVFPPSFQQLMYEGHSVRSPAPPPSFPMCRKHRHLTWGWTTHSILFSNHQCDSTVSFNKLGWTPYAHERHVTPCVVQPVKSFSRDVKRSGMCQEVLKMSWSFYHICVMCQHHCTVYNILVKQEIGKRFFCPHLSHYSC